MEETIKMKTKNEEGVEIIKDVPKSLYSNYIAIGWTEYKETPKKSFAKDSFNINKDNKDNGNI